MVEAVAALRLPVASNRRLRALMNRNNDAGLNADERAEMGSLVEISETMSLVRGDALKLLRRQP